MAKKPAYPTKPCPKCSKPIHARKTSHEACGWVAAANGAPAATKPATKPKNGRRKKTVHAAATSSEISIQDIQAVKKVVEQLGAEKVVELARVLAR